MTSARASLSISSRARRRRHLEELSSVADDLLLLAPTQEPPVGFESRVLDELEERSERPERRRRRPLIAVAAAAVAALVTASAMWLAFDDDRDLADRYRETLAVANGKYLAAAPLSAAGGRRAGTVFGYEGDPSWVLVTVYESARPEPGRYELEVITAKGRRMDLRPMWIYSKGQRRRRDPDPLPRRHRGAPARPRPRECPPR